MLGGDLEAEKTYLGYETMKVKPLIILDLIDILRGQNQTWRALVIQTERTAFGLDFDFS